MDILLQTPTGSRLYGLHHAESDYDYYTVVDKVKSGKAKYATHTIIGERDSTVVDFGTWVNLLQKGVPQALEAAFSTQATTDRIAEFRAGFRAGTNYEAYRGVMKVMSIEHPDSYKHKRHVIRLALNLRDLRTYNRFDPTLNAMQLELVNELAHMPMEYVYNDAMKLAWG